MWLGKEITFNVNDQIKTYPVGERVNWFRIGDGEPDVAEWSSWGNILAEAYLASRETEVSLEEEILAAHALLDDEIGAAAL